MELLIHRWMDTLHARPAGALRVELKVIVTHCSLRTRAAPDRHAKPLRLAGFKIRNKSWAGRRSEEQRCSRRAAKAAEYSNREWLQIAGGP